MRTEKGFTKIDSVVVLCCVGFLMTSLGAVGNAGREKAKETVCLSNLGKWGKMFQLWLNDHNGIFPNGHDKWFHALAPYYGAAYRDSKIRREYKMRFCPTAVKFSDEGAQQPSAAWEAGLTYGGPDDSEKAWDMYYWDGSFGTNSWVYNATNTVLIRGAQVEVTWKTANVKNANQIPMLLDSWSFGGRPQDQDGPPQIPGDIVNFGNDYMKTFMIDRHNGSVNAVFMDFSARSVGLKELYTLKWHRAYNTCNKYTKCGNATSNTWPEWMRGFKDY